MKKRVIVLGDIPEVNSEMIDEILKDLGLKEVFDEIAEDRCPNDTYKSMKNFAKRMPKDMDEIFNYNKRNKEKEAPCKEDVATQAFQEDVLRRFSLIQNELCDIKCKVHKILKLLDKENKK